jgi:hypothetical protein
MLPALLAAPVVAHAREVETGEKDNNAVDFSRDVQPLLRRSCWSCHGEEAEEGGLRLDVRKRALEGGDGGRVIEPGRGVQSRLIAVVKGADEDIGIMPPEGEGTPLSAEEITRLQRWIDSGAVWPETSDAGTKKSDHWAFQPIRRPAVPAVKEASPVRNPIDAFVLARLQGEGISPSPPAEPSMLLRRVHVDLIGLPPEPEIVPAFLEDPSDERYQSLVRQLLDSPHFGERWARHWLDLARYADSDGYEKDRPRPFAWRYREWVIDALNQDMPFDQFSIAQIAGDMLPGQSLEQRVACGFHRNTLHNTEGGVDREEDRVKKTVDRTNTFGSIWLGITVGCAQCHSHKYDPLTQREYYSLYAFFNSMNETDIVAPLPSEAAAYQKAQAAFDAGHAKQAPKAPASKARSVVELTTPRTTRVHLRGDFLNQGDVVPVGVPDVLPRLTPRGEGPDRLDLAHWLFDTANPLTARVTVNRIWQRYFGRGIVATIDDFGSQGDPPSHPELLDWLAAEFRDSGWSRKHIHRLIVTSSTYRQSSASRPDLVDVDPENVLLARQSRRRVEAEIVRDLALAVSGLLFRKVGGPSVRPPQPGEYSKLTYANSARWTTSSGEDRYRRGLYTFFQRTSPYPMLMTFDSPDSTACIAQRSTSNTPLQALTLWNDAVFFECAQQLGRRIVVEAGIEEAGAAQHESRVRYAFQLCLARNPRPAEMDIIQNQYAELLQLARRDPQAAAGIAGDTPVPAGVTQEELAAWIMVARTLLNLDEFITRE